MMEDLTVRKTNIKCIGCNAWYNYLKYENLLYGFKEDSTFCNDCYYKYLEDLVKLGRDLRGNDSFNGGLDN
jgi:hypothetical protein